MKSKKLLERIIKKYNMEPLKDNDLVSGKRFKSLIEDFKEYDKRRGKILNDVMIENGQLKNKLKEKNKEISELKEQLKELKKNERNVGWILENNLPTPPPEMI